MKDILRRTAKIKRKTLNVSELSLKIKKNLFAMKEYESAKNIFCYYSFGEEVSTTDYFEDKSKNWFLPKISDNNMLVCPFDKDSLVLNKYNIYEPQTDAVSNLNQIDMIIIPALCADKNGYRIGYGKGYYDRFIKMLKHNPLKVVLSYSDLIVNDIYPEEFDEKCDVIVTDKFVIKI